MLIPGVIFGALALVPWIERRLTGDRRDHHLLDRPRDATRRTALGVASTTFVAVLFLGGSQDVIAGTFDVSIGRITTILQISALVAPPLTYVITLATCRALATRPAPERTERAGGVARDAGGGYHGSALEEHETEIVPEIEPVEVER
jgi:ubiquinol-cytochrome c reductase cytochrome b subunit